MRERLRSIPTCAPLVQVMQHNKKPPKFPSSVRFYIEIWFLKTLQVRNSNLKWQVFLFLFFTFHFYYFPDRCISVTGVAYIFILTEHIISVVKVTWLFYIALLNDSREVLSYDQILHCLESENHSFFVRLLINGQRFFSLWMSSRFCRSSVNWNLASL